MVITVDQFNEIASHLSYRWEPRATVEQWATVQRAKKVTPRWWMWTVGLALVIA